VELDAGEIAVGEEGLGVVADQVQVETFEEVVGAVAAAQGHDGGGAGIGEGGVEVG